MSLQDKLIQLSTEDNMKQEAMMVAKETIAKEIQNRPLGIANLAYDMICDEIAKRINAGSRVIEGHIDLDSANKGEQWANSFILNLDSVGRVLTKYDYIQLLNSSKNFSIWYDRDENGIETPQFVYFRMYEFSHRKTFFGGDEMSFIAYPEWHVFMKTLTDKCGEDNIAVSCQLRPAYRNEGRYCNGAISLGQSVSMDAQIRNAAYVKVLITYKYMVK